MLLTTGHKQCGPAAAGLCNKERAFWCKAASRTQEKGEGAAKVILFFFFLLSPRDLGLSVINPERQNLGPGPNANLW